MDSSMHANHHSPLALWFLLLYPLLVGTDLVFTEVSFQARPGREVYWLNRLLPKRSVQGRCWIIVQGCCCFYFLKMLPDMMSSLYDRLQSIVFEKKLGGGEGWSHSFNIYPSSIIKSKQNKTTLSVSSIL